MEVHVWETDSESVKERASAREGARERELERERFDRELRILEQNCAICHTFIHPVSQSVQSVGQSIMDSGGKRTCQQVIMLLHVSQSVSRVSQSVVQSASKSARNPVSQPGLRQPAGL